MLALQGYGSSDDHSSSDDETSTEKTSVEVKKHDVPLNKPITSLSLQICAAPDVVPSVSCPFSLNNFLIQLILYNFYKTLQ